jgi:hypothetical protein
MCAAVPAPLLKIVTLQMGHACVPYPLAPRFENPTRPRLAGAKSAGDGVVLIVNSPFMLAMGLMSFGQTETAV